MADQTEREGGDAGSRSAQGRRFEVFVRESVSDPLTHVGTVAAPTPDIAHEEASDLFGWTARDVWVCPAAETHRYSTESLSADDRDGDDPDADEREADERDGDGPDAAATNDPEAAER